MIINKLRKVGLFVDISIKGGVICRMQIHLKMNKIDNQFGFYLTAYLGGYVPKETV